MSSGEYIVLIIIRANDVLPVPGEPYSNICDNLLKSINLITSLYPSN